MVDTKLVVKVVGGSLMLLLEKDFCKIYNISEGDILNVKIRPVHSEDLKKYS